MTKSFLRRFFLAICCGLPPTPFQSRFACQLPRRGSLSRFAVLLSFKQMHHVIDLTNYFFFFMNDVQQCLAFTQKHMITFVIIGVLKRLKERLFLCVACHASAQATAECDGVNGLRHGIALHIRPIHLPIAAYASSSTGSHHSFDVSSPSTSIARCANQLSAAAPCQCLTPAGMLTTVPGVIATGASPHA